VTAADQSVFRKSTSCWRDASSSAANRSRAAFALGARWLTEPMRRLVRARDALGRSVAGQGALPVLDERSGTVEVREAARVFNGMARELDAQFKSRGLLMASLSHDLKTPLTRIRMRLENLAVGDDGLAQRSIADIHEANALLDLALGAFRSGGEDQPMQTVDVAALLQSMVDDRIEQGQPVVFAGEGVALASARPLALRRVFDNLLNNAIATVSAPTSASSPTTSASASSSTTPGRASTRRCSARCSSRSTGWSPRATAPPGAAGSASISRATCCVARAAT
jgi:signal transduction histidine kinase